MMNESDSNLDLSGEAWTRLRREQAFLDQARTLFRSNDDDTLYQLAFSEIYDNDDAIGVVRQYVALIDRGITPPPNILATLALGLRRYLKANGTLSLDDAFGLSRKQRIGHPLTHRNEREKRGQIAYLMWCLRRKHSLQGEPISIEAAAGEVINRFNLPYHEDTLKKDYINLNADEVFDKAYEVIQEFQTNESNLEKK